MTTTIHRRSPTPRKAPRATAGRAPTRMRLVAPEAASRPPRRQRPGWLIVPLVMLAVLIIAMLVRLQVENPEAYVRAGWDQRSLKVPLLGLRGSILDRNGEALALSVSAEAIVADPRFVEDPRRAAEVIAPILGLSIDSLEADLGRPDTGFVYLARGVEPELADRVTDAVERAGVSGVYSQDEEQRIDPGDDLALSVIGQVKKGEVNEPLFGIERSLDSHLRGVEGEKQVEIGHLGDHSTIVGSENILKPARAGADVTLTLDRPLQFWAEKVLGDQLVAIGAQAGTVIVGRPQTGEILAMASMSNKDGVASSSQLNLAVRAYEPGSVMKLVTVAGAFEEQLVQPETTLSVADSIRLYDKVIKDSHSHKVEQMSVNRIISESSNVGTIHIAQMLGKDRILDYIDRFGFGKMSHLGLYKEQTGVVRTDWSGTDIGSIPIGQSITVTPVQMWAAYNVIANGGVYVAPRLVTDIVDTDGHHATPDMPPTRRVVSADTAAKVNGALREVVEEGTGQALKIPGLSVAAKTGTAYKPIPGHGYLLNGQRRYDASFVGFFPATNPQLSIMVLVDEPPLGKHFGAVAAGPVFDRLARLAMKRFAIPGDVALESEGKGAVRAPAAVAVEPVPDLGVVAPGPNGPDGVAPDPASAQALAAAAVPPPTEPEQPEPSGPSSGGSPPDG